MFDLDTVRRVTAAGTATFNGVAIFFAVGRIVDTRRFAQATLTAAGITTVPVLP